MIEKDLENELKLGIYHKRPILKAIKLKCMDCCGGDWNEVKLCQAKESCFLHPFRLGKNPFNVRELTDEERQALRDRLVKMREAKNAK